MGGGLRASSPPVMSGPIERHDADPGLDRRSPSSERSADQGSREQDALGGPDPSMPDIRRRASGVDPTTLFEAPDMARCPDRTAPGAGSSAPVNSRSCADRPMPDQPGPAHDRLPSIPPPSPRPALVSRDASRMALGDDPLRSAAASDQRSDEPRRWRADVAALEWTRLRLGPTGDDALMMLAAERHRPRSRRVHRSVGSDDRNSGCGPVRKNRRFDWVGLAQSIGRAHC